MHEAFPHNPRLAGTWALRQVGSVSEFDPGNATRIAIDAALAFEKLAGFSVRVEWRDLEPTRNNYDFSILTAAKARADAFGLPLAVRFMAGFRCPTYLFTTDGCRFFSSYDRHSGVGGIVPNTAGTVNVGTTTTALTNTTTPDTVTVTETSVVPETPFTIQLDSEFIVVPARTLISGSTYRYGTSGSAPIIRASTSGTTTNPIAAHAISTTVTIGGRIPDPCDVDGTPNQVFADRWEALVAVLAAWGRAQVPAVPFLHIAWPGLYWSEIYNDYPLRPGDGRPGYSTNIGGQSQECIDAHKNLVTRAAIYTGPDLAMEGANSGHGANGQILTQLQSHIRATFGDYSPEFYIQANNIDTGITTGWPVGISKGLQLVASTSNYTEANWEEIYRDILISPERGDYIEVYVGLDFTDANAKFLQREIYRFWRLTHADASPMMLPIGA